jgi:zinc protease
MVKRIVHLLCLFVFLGAQSSFALDGGSEKQCPLIPQAAQQFVQRTIASKPGDFFVVLKNGLTLLVHSQPDAEVVSTQVFVKAGSILEGKYMGGGLSHYLEHVLSGGSTRSFTEAEGKARMDRIGGATNAYTTYDRTVYYINTSSDNWKEALDLLLSSVTENILDPGEVQREKAVIQQEMKLGEANLSGELWKLFTRTAYAESPVRIPVIGREEVFVQQDRDALLDYYTQRYQPENMILAVSGNVNPEAVLEFVGQKTKDFLPRKSEPVFAPAEPAQVSSRWEEREIPIARAVTAMAGFPSVTIFDSDLYALDVLSQLMGEGESCRLYCRLKIDQNKVLGVSASDWTPSFVRGQFIITVSLAANQWPGVLKDIEEEINSFKTTLVSPGELEKAKKSAIASHIFAQETVSARASSLAASYLSTGDPYFDDTYVEQIRKVTAESIRSAAQRYLLMDKMNVAVIKPPAAPHGPQAAAPQPAAPKEGPSAANGAARDTSSAGYHQLPNGLKVLTKQDSSLPFVTIHLFGTGGLVLEDPGHPGIANFTASLITAGTKKRTRLEINQTIESGGGVLYSKSDNNSYHVAVKVLKEDMGTALDILADLVQNAQFPPEEIEKERQDTLLAIKRADEVWQSEIMRLFKKNYFHDSTYGSDKLGTAESVNAFKREDLLAFYGKMVNPTHSVLAVYGDLDSDAALAEIRQKFGGWSGASVQLAKLPLETTQVKDNRTVEIKNDKSSAALFVGTNGVDVASPKRPALELISAMLVGSGRPSGRIFQALRGGNEYLVYAVHAFPFLGQKAGYFGVLTQTTMGNLEKVQGIILSNLKRLAEEPVPVEELDKIKTVLLVSQQLGRDSLDNQAQSAALNEVLGLGWQYDQRYPDLIRSVTPRQVQDLAKELFGHTLIARTIPEHPVEILAAPPMPSQDVHVR